MPSFAIKEVVGEELIYLKEKLEKTEPKPLTVYGTLEVLTDKIHPKKPKMKVYQAEEPMFQSFIFIAPIFFNDEFPSMTVNWDPMEIEDEDVGRLFFNIPNWDWDRQFIANTNSEDLHIRFHDLFKNKFLITDNASKMECTLVNPCFSLTVQKESIPPIVLPLGYKLGPLPPSAATMMHSLWNNSHRESPKEISRRLETYEGVGVFHKDKNDSSNNPDHALAWVQQYAFGAIGMTHTLPEHRKKGFGTAVTLTLAKQVLEESRTAFITVNKPNKASLQFHLKIGFKIYGPAVFATYVPSDSKWMNLFPKSKEY